MIRMKFSDTDETIGIYQGPRKVVSLDPAEFGDLIREVRRIMQEASPVLARKEARKEERRQLLQQLKIMVAIRVIDFWRWIKSLFIFK